MEIKRKLASVQKIINLEPIEGADKIERATVLGWQLVVKKGEFKKGDLCVYFEIDSLLPLREEFKFLEKGSGIKTMVYEGKEYQGYRLKTVRLRGQISQGLALPLSILPKNYEYGEGYDLTEELNILKYEPPIPVSLSGIARGVFPGFIEKTDATRIQAVPNILTTYENTKFFITEKLDGASMTVFIQNNELHVCGRTIDLLESPKNSYWTAARAQKLEEILKTDMLDSSIGRYVLQGELVGNGIQKNVFKMHIQKFFCYNVFDRKEQRFLNCDEFIVFCKTKGIETVPIISTNQSLPKFVNTLVYWATRYSTINPEVWAEGIVIKPMQEINDDEIGRLVLKVINPEYLLHHD